MNTPTNTLRRRRGFTLIELMVTIAIAGILATIAMPVYRTQMRKARRSDAKSALMDLASREERYFAFNNRYTGSSTDLGYPAAFPLNITSSGAANGSSYYTLNVTLTNANNITGYTSIATPTGDQAGDTECFAYTLDQRGVKSNVSSANQPLNNPACW